MPLIRAPRTLPRVLAPAEVDAFVGALRTRRDRAMAEAMVLGGLRRCEVLGLRLGDLHPGERRVFVSEGKGARDRIVPVSARFFATVAEYFETERPRTSVTDKGVRGVEGPASRPAALGGRAGRDRGRCPGTGRGRAPDLSPAQAHLLHPLEGGGHGARGHPGPGRPRVDRVDADLPAPGDWLAGEYLRAAEAIEAQAADL